MEYAVYLKGEDTDMEAILVQDNRIEVYSPALGEHRGPYQWGVVGGFPGETVGYVVITQQKQWSEMEELYWRSYFRPREQRM